MHATEAFGLVFPPPRVVSSRLNGSAASRLFDDALMVMRSYLLGPSCRSSLPDTSQCVCFQDDCQFATCLAGLKRTLTQLKHVCQIEHTRHRSPINAYVNILAALVAYTWQEHKPSLYLSDDERELLLKAAV